MSDEERGGEKKISRWFAYAISVLGAVLALGNLLSSILGKIFPKEWTYFKDPVMQTSVATGALLFIASLTLTAITLGYNSIEKTRKNINDNEAKEIKDINDNEEKEMEAIRDIDRNLNNMMGSIVQEIWSIQNFVSSEKNVFTKYLNTRETFYNELDTMIRTYKGSDPISTTLLIASIKNYIPDDPYKKYLETLADKILELDKEGSLIHYNVVIGFPKNSDGEPPLYRQADILERQRIFSNKKIYNRLVIKYEEFSSTMDFIIVGNSVLIAIPALDDRQIRYGIRVTNPKIADSIKRWCFDPLWHRANDLPDDWKDEINLSKRQNKYISDSPLRPRIPLQADQDSISNLEGRDKKREREATREETMRRPDE